MGEYAEREKTVTVKVAAAGVVCFLSVRSFFELRIFGKNENTGNGKKDEKQQNGKFDILPIM